MRRVVLFAIRLYQRYLSPRKGFACAYRVHTGRRSCSALGYRAVRAHGVFAGLRVLKARTYRCGVAHRRFLPSEPRGPMAQRGVCDCDLPCDLDPTDCCDCDWPERKKDRKENRKREKHVHIPPYSPRRNKEKAGDKKTAGDKEKAGASRGT